MGTNHVYSVGNRIDRGWFLYTVDNMHIPCGNNSIYRGLLTICRGGYTVGCSMYIPWRIEVNRPWGFGIYNGRYHIYRGVYIVYTVGYMCVQPTNVTYGI